MDWILIFWFITIYLVSLVWNWGIQLSYYYICISRNPATFKNQRTLLNYLTGIVGDGIVVPLINIFIFYVLYRLEFRPSLEALVQSFFLALILDIAAHYVQGRLKLVNWSMPKPFKWNFAGYWHMISFPFQIGYILLFFNILIMNIDIVMSEVVIRYALYSVLGLMIVFILLYCRDNKWL